MTLAWLVVRYQWARLWCAVYGHLVPPSMIWEAEEMTVEYQPACLRCGPAHAAILEELMR